MGAAIGTGELGSPGSQTGAAGTGSVDGIVPTDPPSLVNVPPQPSPPTVVIGRQMLVDVTVNGTSIMTAAGGNANVIGFRLVYSVNDPVPRCTLVTRYVPGNYDTEIKIFLGTLLAPWSAPAPSTVPWTSSIGSAIEVSPANGAPLRFSGRIRNPTYTPYPRMKSTECPGRLILAQEFLNNFDPNRLGGLPINNCELPPLYPDAQAAGIVDTNDPVTAGQIFYAALNRVPELRTGAPALNPADFTCSGRVYGANRDIFNIYIWSAGTPQASITQGLPSPFFIPQAGESVVDYIRRWSQIECTFIPDTSGIQPPADKGGFYLLLQTPDGVISTKRIGGRPRGDPDTSNGAPIILTEGVNVLSEGSSITRKYPQANRTLVKGLDWGFGDIGQVYYELVSANDFMKDANNLHYDPSQPSSQMIKWPTQELAILLGRPTGPNAQPVEGIEQAVEGMDAQTVASVRLLDLNRIEVVGTIETVEDFYSAQGQTHRVQGAGGQPDRLGTGENVWCESVTMDFHLGQYGEPILRQTFTYRGGGAPDATNPTVVST